MAEGDDEEGENVESRVLIIMTGLLAISLAVLFLVCLLVRNIVAQLNFMHLGGTICMKHVPGVGYVPARGFLKSGLGPRPSFNDGSYPEPLELIANESGTKKAVQSLRTPLSIYGRRVRYSVLEFDQLLDSSSIDSHGWTLIARTIARNYRLFDGFVVLHGTDSLAYSASALSFMLQNLGKPVILTGSQVPMLELQSDATDNLLSSLIIAGHFMIPEVCLFFSYKLFRGNRTTKTSATDFAAFESRNHEPLAVVESLRTKVNWDLVLRPKEVHPFSIQANLDTAHVASLRIFPGMKPEMVDAVLKVAGLRGLVLETFGSGNAPGGSDGALMRVLSEALDRGIVIVSVTQCLHGSVGPVYASASLLSSAGVVFGLDMTTEAALTKLAYLLAAMPGAEPTKVAELMATSLRGELTDVAPPVFANPNRESLSPRLASLTALAYAIDKGDLERVRDVMRGQPAYLLNDADYSGNTPLHLSATGPNASILRDFLSQGASVHLRNRSGHTPLFQAAQAGLNEHVRLLREAGAHLHSGEVAEAEMHVARRKGVGLGGDGSGGDGSGGDGSGGGAGPGPEVWALALGV